MSLLRLVLREIGFRKLTFVISALAVTATVACATAAVLLLEDHRLQTEFLVAERSDEIAALVRQNEDETRKTMKKLGFNILILPKNQNLHDLYAEDFGSHYMPESYVDTLANSSIVTVNHLLPSLTRKVLWPERQRMVIVTGVRGEVPILHRDPKKPIQDAVPTGKIVLGYELHTSLGLKVGDHLELMDREFEVATCHPQRGNKDDITLWIDLATAQELFDQRGQINAILALECNCTAERLPIIRQEIASILPDTQVIERGSQATARAEARMQARRLAEDMLDELKAGREDLYAEREAFASVLVPLVLIGCALLVGVLAFLNVRERRAEIGILRALGLSASRIIAVFLGKAFIIGLAGAAIGYFVGLAITFVRGESAVAHTRTWALFDGPLLTAIAVLAPLIAMAASWLPALAAAQTDPAETLREN